MQIQKEVESLREVESICLGYIDGNTHYVNAFKQNLKDELTARGFEVKDTDCDATMIGSLQAVYSPNSIVPTTIAYAQVSLLNQKYQSLWKEKVKPNCSIAYKFKTKCSFSDGVKNRAADVARKLEKAKAKAK